nr:MAG TPA: hypothetical protein [Caudoviricetes sp.]
MALKKEIELENGVMLNYHRIVSFNKITNISNVIEIASYTNEKQRKKEEKYQEIQRKNANNEELSEEEKKLLKNGINVFIDTDMINIPYNEDMTIEKAYEYIKTTEKYSNAADC